MQISDKYSIVYVITKLGLLFVYDLETATAIYRNRISPDPIFLAVGSETTGGFYAINRCGSILGSVLMQPHAVPHASSRSVVSPMPLRALSDAAQCSVL